MSGHRVQRSERVGIFDERTGDILLVCTYRDLRNAGIALIEQSNRDRELVQSTRVSPRNTGLLTLRYKQMREFAGRLLGLEGVMNNRRTE